MASVGRLSRRTPLYWTSIATALTLAGCGGGGGGGGGGSTPDLGGAISVFGASDAVFEAEPNDTVGQAHFLGTFSSGNGATVHGSCDATSDTIDAFRIDAPERLAFDVELTFDDPTTNDLDVLIYDTVSSNFVQYFTSTDSPEVGSFHAKGSFLIVVNAFAGASSYTLRVDASTPSDPIAEAEPNDDNLIAQYLGEMLAGDSVDVSGSASALSDVSDRLLVTFPEDADLDLSLAHASGADFDLVVYDATADPENPTEVARFDSMLNPEQGSVTGIPAGVLLQIEVLASSASGAWTLSLSAGPPTTAPAGGWGRAWRAARAPELRRNLRGHALPEGFFLDPTEARTGEAIVLPRPGVDLAPRLAARSARALQRVPGGAIHVAIDLPANATESERQRLTLAWIQSLNARSEVLYCEPNYVYRVLGEPTDPFYNLQWHYELIQLPAAWDLTQGNANVIVAVIDTGETAHPDLVARQIAGYDMISDPSNAADGDGTDPDPTDEGDSNGTGPSSFHGTHVAGTIGASTNNAVGVAGVNWAGKIMHVRALGKQGGTVFDIANAIRFAAKLSNSSGDLPAQKAKVINMSLGGPGFSQTMADAVTAARGEGVVVFAAAGNENSSEPSYPAAYPGVISVAAVDFQGNKAPYSNFHSTVDIAAPGGDVSADLNGDGYPDGVLSTLVDDSGPQDQYVYAFYQGTSMACPHAAGVAALMLSVNPSLGPNQIETILESTATDRGAPGRDNIYGHGLINAAAAVNEAAGGGSTTPVLSLGTDSMTFEIGETTQQAAVFNVGGGLLEVGTPTTSTDAGGNWLAAARVASSNSNLSDTDAITVTVNRSGLADGLYTGTVTVPSNGGTAQIAISLLVGTAVPPEDVDIFVLVIDSETFETVAEVTVNPTTSLDYSFADLPAGAYYLFAGSDDDNDGFICGEGDTYCGAWPTINEPGLVTIEDGSPLAGVDFAVNAGFSGLSSGGMSGIARLH